MSRIGARAAVACCLLFSFSAAATEVIVDSRDTGWSAAKVETMASLDYAELVNRSEVLRFFSQMTDRAAGTFEEAAFILRMEDGSLLFAPWPRSRTFRGARWRGSIPANVIAIAHTHPFDFTGLSSSSHDVLEARRINLPIFIVMRGRISVADPKTGQHLVLLRGERWRSPFEEIWTDYRVADGPVSISPLVTSRRLDPTRQAHPVDCFSPM
jgi:hypothetical protein